jgi:ribonuclease R
MESVQTEIGAQLHLAYMLAQALFLQRQRREALALYDLTLGWTTTEEGQLRPLPAEEHYNTHRIPAEFMILANQCFASFLEQRDVPALYRNHRARVIGAERSLLLQQMETALAHPEQQSFQQVRATTDLVLERASYAPTVLGHFGLNLPVYIHLTSPLRRYADLVNQRILLAVLAEDANPFSKEMLEAKAAVINREEQARKAAQKSQFLSVYDTELQQSIEESEEGDEATRLIALDTRRFHSLLRIVAQSQALSPALEKEILRRLELHLLKANDLFTLLFRFPTTGGEPWQSLQEALLRWLPQQPDFAVSILLMGQQTLGWGMPSYNEEEHPDTPGRFEATVRITLPGKDYSSTSQRASQKALARQFACVDLLGKIAGFEDLLSSPTTAAVLQTASASPETETGVQGVPNTSEANIIGYLNEMQQKRAIRSVDYHFQSPESAQHPIFLCFCTITTNEGHCIEGSGSGKTKRAAKEAATLEALKLWIFEMEQDKTSDVT